jgi:hypothetical protein
LQQRVKGIEAAHPQGALFFHPRGGACEGSRVEGEEMLPARAAAANEARAFENANVFGNGIE